MVEGRGLSNNNADQLETLLRDRVAALRTVDDETGDWLYELYCAGYLSLEKAPF